MTDALLSALRKVRAYYDCEQRHNALMRSVYAARIEAGEILLKPSQAARWTGLDYEYARSMARGGRVNVKELRARERRAA